MIKSAVKKGEFVKNDTSGKVYQVVKFEDLVILVELDKIAAGIENLLICDFWKVSGKYLQENFTKVNQ